MMKENANYLFNYIPVSTSFIIVLTYWAYRCGTDPFLAGFRFLKFFKFVCPSFCNDCMKSTLGKLGSGSCQKRPAPCGTWKCRADFWQDILGRRWSRESPPSAHTFSAAHSLPCFIIIWNNILILRSFSVSILWLSENITKFQDPGCKLVLYNQLRS